MAVKSGEQKGVPAGRKNPSRNAFVPYICSPLSLDALAGVSPAPPRGGAKCTCINPGKRSGKAKL